MSLTSEQITALNSELVNDPLNMGYDLTATKKNLDLLNNPELNIGGETTAETLTVGLLHKSMVPADFSSNQVSDGDRRIIESYLGRDFSVNIDEYKGTLRSLFKTNSTTVANIDALIRKLSRGEVLFGEDTYISKSDFLTARDL